MTQTFPFALEKVCFHSRFKILKKEGEGTFGSVYKTLDQQTNCIVAVKVFNNEDFGGIGVQSTTFREITHLKQLQHKNIIKLLAIGTDVNRLCYIMEYCETSLRTLINRSISINDAQNIFKQIILME